MKTYHYSDKFKTNGETLGPVTIEELEQLYLQNKITEQCMVLQNDSDEWCRYLQVLAEIQEAKKEKLRANCFSWKERIVLVRKNNFLVLKARTFLFGKDVPFCVRRFFLVWEKPIFLLGKGDLVVLGGG